MGSTRSRNSTRRAQRPRPLPDLHAILGRLARTRNFFTVILRSIKSDDRDERLEETEVLEEALAALNTVYDELDLAGAAINAAFNKLGVADPQVQRAKR